MFIVKSDRRHLLDFIQNRSSGNLLEVEEDSINSYLSLYGDELLLIWSQKPILDSYLPECICVSEGKVSDFLAWATTYLKSFFPFTAYCRVVDTLEIKRIRNYRIRSIDRKVESALIGTIIGETISLFENSEIKHQNLLAAKSTFSYALAKSYILGIPNNGLTIFETYKKLYSFSNARNRSFLNTIQEIWQILFLAFDRDSLNVSNLYDVSNETMILIGALQDIINTGEISSYRLTGLLQMLRNNSLVIMENHDHRESKLMEFEKFAESLALQSNINSMVAGFTCAYLVNNIAPGTFEHNNVIKPYVLSFPSLYTWYAIIAGLTNNSDILRYNLGFGYRILRDLYKIESLFKRPQSDISYAEFEMIANSKSSNQILMSESQTHILIELAPLIDSVMALPANNKLKADNNSYSQIKNELSKEEVFLQKVMLEQLGKALSEASHLYDAITGKQNIQQTSVAKKPKDLSKKNRYNSSNRYNY